MGWVLGWVGILVHLDLTWTWTWNWTGIDWTWFRFVLGLLGCPGEGCPLGWATARVS